VALDDKYDIQASIHIGQITSAHPAVEIATGRKALLKVLHPQWSEDREIAERFSREAAALARIDHPNVVRVIDQGREDGIAYLALEWIDGGNLAERIAAGPLPQPEIKALATGILKGLQAVHAAGLVHRDLKPDNILIDHQNRPVLADFSLAGFSGRSDLTEHGAMVGSPAYMAPELLQGEPADARSDLFGVGVILLEALTGSNPYRADDPMASLDRINHLGPPRLRERPSIDPALARLIDSLLEREPRARPENAPAALTILDSANQLPAFESAAIERPSRRTSKSARHSIYYSLGAIVLLLTASLIILNNPFHLVSSSIPPLDNTASPSDTLLTSTDETAAAIPHPDTSTAPAWLPVVRSAVDSAPVRRDTAVAVRAVLPARLSIIARPWARVFIDGVYRGVTPLGTIELPAGKHAIQFRSDVFPTVERTLVLAADETQNLTVDLRLEAGQLAVSAEPWGYLWLDSDSLGLLPRADPLWVKPGAHLLRVAHPSLGELSDSVQIVKGSRIGFLVNLVNGTMIADKKEG